MANKSATAVKIGENIQEIRQRLKMTQSEIATRAGLSTNYFARIERGDATPSIDALEEIVNALKVKSSEILPF
jgi:transcriptional regulator with XRE-family HTH domain